MKIIRAIVKGERGLKKLASYKDKGCRNKDKPSNSQVPVFNSKEATSDNVCYVAYRVLTLLNLKWTCVNQLIRKHRHTLKVKTHTHEVCVIWGKRRDTGEEMEVRYHIEEAARAGLIKDGGGWRKCPEDMLFARAISRLARRLFPDLHWGLLR